MNKNDDMAVTNSNTEKLKRKLGLEVPHYIRGFAASSPRKINLPFFFNLNHRGRILQLRSSMHKATSTLWIQFLPSKRASWVHFSLNKCVVGPFSTSSMIDGKVLNYRFNLLAFF